MGKELDKLAEALDRNAGKARQPQIRFAVCDAVDWDAKTMTATGESDDLPYYNVMLGLGAMNIKPAVGATCLIGIVEGKEALTFLIAAETVEQVELLTADSFVIASDSENLQTILLDIITEIAKIIVVQGTSPNVPALNAISTRIKQLLKK